MEQILEFGYALFDTAALLGDVFGTPVSQLPNMPFAQIVGYAMEQLGLGTFTIGQLFVTQGFLIFIVVRFVKFVVETVKTFVPFV